jgi:hypothetical protein
VEEEDAPLRAEHPGRYPAALIAVAALGCVTACAGGGSPADGPPAAPAAAPDTSAQAAKAEAAEAALAAYTGYLDAMRKAEDAGNPQHPELKKYLADPLLTRVRLAIRDAKENGAMRTGSLGSDPTVTLVTLDSVPAAVEIQDCIDSSKYKLVYRETRKQVPGTGAGRYLATATANRYPDGRWLVSAATAHEDQPC